MVIIERATDLWNPTLGILSITKFQIKVRNFEGSNFITKFRSSISHIFAWNWTRFEFSEFRKIPNISNSNWSSSFVSNLTFEMPNSNMTRHNFETSQKYYFNFPSSNNNFWWIIVYFNNNESLKRAPLQLVSIHRGLTVRWMYF